MSKYLGQVLCNNDFKIMKSLFVFTHSFSSISNEVIDKGTFVHKAIETLFRFARTSNLNFLEKKLITC